MSAEGHADRFRQLEESYKDYTVYDRHYEKIGKVDDLFVDRNDEPEYIGVKTGFLGTKFTLIPMEIARVNDRRKLIEIAADKDAIKDAPSFDDDEEITSEREHRIHAYFGLERPGSWDERGGYSDYYSDRDPYAREDLAGSVDTQYGERTDEPLEQPITSPPPREERYDTGSSRSVASGQDNLDIPLKDTERRPRGYVSPREEPVEPKRDLLGADDTTARTGGGDQAFADEGKKVRGMRVHKRAGGRGR